MTVGCFRTLAQAAESELVVERSRFLGCAEPIASLQAALDRVAALKREHHSARHVCFGLRVGHGATLIDRSNDDGEPARTGGFPLWQMLEGDDVTDALVTVVRYFGGVKLGTGGLARAYRQAGREALDDAGILEVWPEVAMDVVIGYAMVARLEHLLVDLHGVEVDHKEFAGDVKFTLRVRKSEIDAVQRRLSELLQSPPESFEVR